MVSLLYSGKTKGYHCLGLGEVPLRPLAERQRIQKNFPQDARQLCLSAIFPLARGRVALYTTPYVIFNSP